MKIVFAIEYGVYGIGGGSGIRGECIASGGDSERLNRESAVLI